MKRTAIGHSRGQLHAAAAKKKAHIEAKRQQVEFAETMLKEWEKDESDNHEYVLHLRAKLRQKRNELMAMGV